MRVRRLRRGGAGLFLSAAAAWSRPEEGACSADGGKERGGIIHHALIL